MNVLDRENAEMVPLGAYSFLLPRGREERWFRNRGCGLFHFEKAYTTYLEGIKVCTWEVKEAGGVSLIRRYITPVGELSEVIRSDPGYHSQWIREHLIKEAKDYEVARFLVEHTYYEPNYGVFQEIRDNLGEDGVLIANMDRTPFQKVLIELAGPERLCLDLVDHPGVVEDLLEALAIKQDEMHRISIGSPAVIIHTWDNVTEEITSPRLFERYCLPQYQRLSTLIHQQKKLFMVHLDGKLAHLERLIDQSGIDIIESLSLPDVGGNISPDQLCDIWPDKAIMANVPAFLCFQSPAFIDRYIRELVSMIPRQRFMFCISEDLPPAFWRKAISAIMKSLKQQG